MQLPTDLKSDTFQRKPIKPWQNWVSINLAIMVLLTIGVIGLLIIAALVPLVVHAEELPACASIKAVRVEPQAIVKVVDGDTFHVFTFDVPNVVKIRVMDAETPERGEEGFEEAKEFTREWLHRGPFRAVTCGQQTFDRIVYMITRDGETLADALKAAGHWREKH